MKKRNGVLALLLLVVSVLAWYPTAVLAGGPDGSNGAPAESEVPFGQVARYLATYMNSVIFSGQVRSATVVSVTNQGATTCGVSVDWRRGFDPGIISCTTNLNLAPGVTADYCSRPLPFGVTNCNATCFPALTFHEGNARIASTSSSFFPASTCSRIAVSTRVIYFSTTSDAVPSAITDSNIVRINSGNSGD